MPRLMEPGGRLNLRRVGLRDSPVRDLYHYLMVSSWPVFLSWLGIGWLIFNLVFAGLFWLGGDCLLNARQGRFDDAFYFSVQTMATIGYGGVTPVGTYANLLVTVEAYLAMLVQALVTGLCFAKFSRPTARVLFSRRAVITIRDGRPCLLFRMANSRQNQIIQARLEVVYTFDDVTPEGESTRRLLDLKLKRAQSPFFVMSWTAIHYLDQDSPLAGLDQAALEALRAEIFVTFSGIDETFSQTIYARHSFVPSDLAFGHRFVDIIGDDDRGNRIIDYRKFQDIAPDHAGNQ